MLLYKSNFQINAKNVGCIMVHNGGVIHLSLKMIELIRCDDMNIHICSAYTTVKITTSMVEEKIQRSI